MIDLSSRVWARVGKLALSLSIGFVASCAAPVEEHELANIGSVEQHITAWETLTLLNGWAANPANPPRIAKTNNSVIFRGAMNGNSATSTIAFNLPEEYQTTDPMALEIRVLMGNQKTGRFLYNPFDVPNAVRVVQDGLSDTSLGDGKGFVSFDGVTFDVDSTWSQGITAIGKWAPVYGHRASGVDSDPVYIGWIANQMRLMGAVTAGAAKDESDNYLFTLPAGYRPSKTVYLPVTLGFHGNANAETGHVRILSTGSMRVYAKSGTMTAANQLVSFENVGWGEQSIKQNLTLVNGWTSGANSTRTAAVTTFDNRVILEGGISGGTSTTFATLPSGLRPSTTIYVALTTTTSATPGRVRIDSNGTMRVDIPNLDTAKLFTSLEGVSFGL